MRAGSLAFSSSAGESPGRQEKLVYGTTVYYYYLPYAFERENGIIPDSHWQWGAGGALVWG